MSSRRSKSTTPLPKKKRKQADLYTIKNVKVISKGEKYKGALVLLTTAIYTNNVPSAAVGKVFLYRVEAYDEETEMYVCMYVCFSVSGLEGLPHLRVYQDHRVGLLHSARTAYRLSDTIFDIHRGGRWS